MSGVEAVAFLPIAVGALGGIALLLWALFVIENWSNRGNK